MSAIASGEISLGLVNGLQLKKQISKQTNKPVTIHPTKPYPTLESALLTNVMIYLEAVHFSLPLKNASLQHYILRIKKKKKESSHHTTLLFLQCFIYIEILKK